MDGRKFVSDMRAKSNRRALSVINHELGANTYRGVASKRRRQTAISRQPFGGVNDFIYNHSLILCYHPKLCNQ